MAGAIMSSTGQSWMTPPSIVNAVLEVFNGSIDLDPCASSSEGTVKAKTKYTGPTAWGGNGMDGLSAPWWGEYIHTVYVNPPYGRNPAMEGILDGKTSTNISDWLKRCADAARHGSEVIATIPAAVDTTHWRKWVWPHAASVCFHYGRVKFYQRNEEGVPVPAKASTFHAIAIVYWGNNPWKFNRVFQRIGTLVQPTIEVAA